MQNVIETELEDAKKNWLNHFNGAAISIPMKIGSPVLRSMMKRHIFYTISRNYHFIAVFGPILLKDGSDNEVEKKLQERMDKLDKMLTAGINMSKALLADNKLQPAHFPQAQSGDFVITTPMSKSLAEIFLKCEEYICLNYALWIHKKMTSEEKSTVERSIRIQLLGLQTSARNLTIGLRKRIKDNQVKGKISDAKAAEAAIKEGESIAKQENVVDIQNQTKEKPKTKVKEDPVAVAA